MRAAFLAVVALVASTCTPPSGSRWEPAFTPTSPDVRLHVTEHFYSVRGRTIPRIAGSLASESPVLNNDHVLGVATWVVAWGGRSTMTAGACRFNDLRVHVTVELILPRLLEPEKASPAVLVQWTAFETAVRDHERGHQSLAYRGGAELLDSLRALRTPSCDGAAEVASATARRILQRFREADRAYDRRTARGASQGAAWPPPWEDG